MKYIRPGTSYLLARCICRSFDHCSKERCPAIYVFRGGIHGCNKYVEERHIKFTWAAAKASVQYILDNNIFRMGNYNGYKDVMEGMKDVFKECRVDKSDIAEFMALMRPNSKVK